ncbi:MAG: hypothetical protein A2Z20_11740 [Bdellovibrionales bacterium RBG_16_40_8]|nr:MAG: hypothetical protein A2Z20_11740 [Bdellovibrionales bacterium RBG_16_40_8]
MVPFIETFQNALKRLEGADISYMIVGSIASMIYGEPRLTRDMDIVIDVEPEDAIKFEKLFTQPEYYCPPIEILSDEIRNRGQFNLLHVLTGLKIDVIVKKVTAFDQSRFARRQRIELWEGFSANLASAEDIILKKLEYFREGGSEKHIRDIRGIISNTEIDHDYLKSWITKLHLEQEWAKVR